MYSILTNRKIRKVSYGIKSYVVKNVEDIKSIPLGPEVASGSQVLISSTGEKYVLDENRSWLKKTTSIPNDEDEVIYEGGDLENDFDIDDELEYDGEELI